MINLISFVTSLVVISVFMYLFETYVPLSEQRKTIVRLLVLIAVIFYMLESFRRISFTTGGAGRGGAESGFVYPATPTESGYGIPSN